MNDDPTEGAEERENRDEDTRNGRFLKPKVFYSFLLFERDVEENPLLFAERLAQQYFVDQYVKMEADQKQGKRKSKRCASCQGISLKKLWSWCFQNAWKGTR